MRYVAIGAGDPGAVDAAVAHLASGGLLVHPTATVYGIGGVPDPDTERELARLKGREPGSGFVHLAGDPAVVLAHWPSVTLSPGARRLAAAAWPGPLTLVLDDGSERGVAVRVEPHEFTRQVLRRYGGVMSSTSLNRGGEPAAGDPAAAREVLAALPESELAVLFVNAGPLPGPPPSTLVRVPGSDGAPFEILRAGALDANRIAAILDGPEPQ